VQNLFFAFEVEIHRTVGNIGRAGDVRDLGIEIAVAGKHFGGSSQNQFALGF
jgi:hypothetical protein